MTCQPYYKQRHSLVSKADQHQRQIGGPGGDLVDVEGEDIAGGKGGYIRVTSQG